MQEIASREAGTQNQQILRFAGTKPGNPNSPNPAQRNPYVKYMINGRFYDINGKLLPNGNIPEAHIPLNQFNINNMPKR